MSNILDIIILIFALARLSYLFTIEAGPWQVLDRWRLFIQPHTAVFDCPYCLSLWLAFAIFIAYSYNESITVGILTPVALSGAALVVLKFYD